MYADHRITTAAQDFFYVEIYCVITIALWSRDGSAVVSLHPPAASMVSSVRFL